MAYDLTELETYIHGTGALYLSGMLDEMLHILMYYSNNPCTVCEHDPTDSYHQLRMLRDLIGNLEKQ